jgi:putative transcriptional regulator
MNKQSFDELIESVREGGKIHRGEKKASRVFSFNPFDIKKIRERTGLSQSEFSTLVHVSLRTLQNWEQGRRVPTGPALALLTIIKNDPAHAIEALY